MSYQDLKYPYTRRLRDMVPEILAEVYNYSEQEVYERELLDIYEGQLMVYVERSLQKELSKEAFAIARQRIAPINILNQIINKIGKTYVDEVERKCEDAKDQELVEYYSDKMDMENVLTEADKLLELHKYCALEPFWHDDTCQLRVLSADTFKVLGHDPINPQKVTCFIKYMGQRKEPLEQVTHRDGTIVNEADQTYRDVRQYHIWTDDEFLIVDVANDAKAASGAVRDDLMNEIGILNDVNPYGRIPFILVKKNSFTLIPKPNPDDLQMSILVPKLLTDANYAYQFNSHSIMYGIDIDPDNVKGNPDSLWILNSVQRDGGSSPEIGTISPTMDIAGGMQLIETQVGMWLQSKGIRAGSIGQPYGDQSISGIAKMIDESDATNVRKERIGIWMNVEMNLWSLIKHMHNLMWVAEEGQEYRYGFTDSCWVYTMFKEPKPQLSEEDELRNIKELMALGLMSKKQALQRYYPDWDQDQVDSYFEEIQEEKMNNMKEFQNGMQQTQGLQQDLQGLQEEQEVNDGYQESNQAAE